MKLVYTEEALKGLQEALDFIAAKVADEKLAEIRDRIVNKADILLDNPFIGQEEEYLDHHQKGHRRIIEGHYKIIYLVEGEVIIVTDIFDTRQDPSKMRG